MHTLKLWPYAVLVTFALCACDNEATSSAPPPAPPPPARPKFLPASSFEALVAGSGVLPAGMEVINPVKFLAHFENASLATDKQPYETDGEYEARRLEDFRKAVAPIELNVEYPFQAESVRFEYSPDRELLTLGIIHDTELTTLLGLSPSVAGKVRALGVGTWTSTNEV